MTLALGARCCDGVAIVEDKMIYKEFSMTGERITYSEKVSGVIRNVIFAYSGDVGLYDIFVKYVAGELVILRDDSAHYINQNMIEKLSDIMDKIRENCKPRGLNVLVGRQFPQNGSSDLHVIKLTGEKSPIDTWTSIGKGSFYSDKLICAYWKNNMNIKEFAGLSYLSGTITTGIVSAKGRLLPDPDSGFSIPNMIQTDAPINPGNSGGPLLNTQGQLIGMNTAIFSSTGVYSGVGFAIPSNTIAKEVPLLIKNSGYVHPWIGITGGKISPELAKSVGLPANYKEY